MARAVFCDRGPTLDCLDCGFPTWLRGTLKGIEGSNLRRFAGLGEVTIVDERGRW